MATAYFVIGSIPNESQAGIANIPDSVPISKESKTTSGSSSATSIAVPGKGRGNGRLFWSVTAVGGDVWVAFGATPVASAGNDWLIPAGSTREFAAEGGQKAAVINA